MAARQDAASTSGSPAPSAPPSTVVPPSGPVTAMDLSQVAAELQQMSRQLSWRSSAISEQRSTAKKELLAIAKATEQSLQHKFSSRVEQVMCDHRSW